MSRKFVLWAVLAALVFAVYAPAMCYELVCKMGGEGSQNGQISCPEGVVVDPAGNVYVADAGNNRIVKFSSSGQFITSWGKLGNGDSEFMGYSPQGLAMDAKGNIYAADRWNHRVQVFDGNGKFLRKMGSEGSGEGQLKDPAGVAVDASGNVYVADYKNFRIVKFDASGSFVAHWGSQGKGINQFSTPIDVAIGPDGLLYVADCDSSRVIKMTTAGKWLTTMGHPVYSGIWFSGLAVDRAGNVYVTSSNGPYVEKYSPKGKLVGTIGKFGSGEQPYGVFVDASGRLFVTNHKTHFVYVFKQ